MQFKNRNHLRILAIADTHGCLNSKTIPQRHNADVCLLLGDLYENDIEIIKKTITEIPIYGVLGNHDNFGLYNRYNLKNIHGDVVVVNGVKIAGLQGSFRYKDTSMPLYTDSESFEIADAMDKADILISHDSPKFFHSIDDDAHSGLYGVTHYCEKHNVTLNIHGHYHKNTDGMLENGTKIICCYGIQLLTY